jgi:hypothetical protein
MKDLKAELRRWTGVERIAVVFIALAMSSMVPARSFSAQGSFRPTFHLHSITTHRPGGC